MKAHKGRIEGTPISVDNFRASECVTHYFLTHGHSDHCYGLTPTWNYSAIYCTEITADYIVQKYKMTSAEIFIFLKVGIRKIIPFVQQKSKDEKLSFAVTPIDANHCPGAVCFLFEGYFGRFLCTGDFRFKRGLFDGFNVFNVDRLYLDDTYCHPNYSPFLSEFECAKEMFRIIQMEKSKNEQIKILISGEELGKEPVMIHLSQLLNECIVCNPQRYKKYKLVLPSIDISKFFTVKHSENTNVFIVNKRQISLKNLDRLNAENEEIEFVAILPSGWSVGNRSLNVSDAGSRKYTLPYSAHSSFEELIECVRHIQPRSVIPIVCDKFSRANVCFSDYLSKDKPKYFVIPPIIKSVLNGHRNIANIAVQHLSKNEKYKKSKKRKVISSLIVNRNKNKKRKRAVFANSDDGKKEKVQIENDDILTQSVELVVNESKIIKMFERKRKRRKYNEMIVGSQGDSDDENKDMIVLKVHDVNARKKTKVDEVIEVSDDDAEDEHLIDAVCSQVMTQIDSRREIIDLT